MRLNLQFVDQGLYYFDLFLDEELATRIPLRVRITRKDVEPKN